MTETIKGSVVLITGACGAIAQALMSALNARGAAKIYAAARDISGLAASPHLVPIKMDVTSDEDVAKAAGMSMRGLHQAFGEHVDCTPGDKIRNVRLDFAKMEGTGNDFVVIDGYRRSVALSREQIRRLADRHFGVGCDQVLLVERPRTNDADFRYRIFNADGSEIGRAHV